jgi:glutaryl-CoA dehydrogenase
LQRRSEWLPSRDYLDFDSLLTEEQRLVRDTVGAWVDDKVLPIIEDAAWEGRFRRSSSPTWRR